MIGKRQEAINKNCRECSYDELCDGTWRDQIEGCHITKCALYDFRPKTIATEQREREQRVMMRQDNQPEGPRLH
mgnify:CR=1 FL=1